MSVRSIYNIYSKFYDYLFSSTFDDARIKAIENLNLEDFQKTIEFGIRTGLSLKFFPKNYDGLTGIDLSDKMLERCALKANKLGMKVDLQIMNCEATSYQDASFDNVILMYVYSVTNDPHKLLKEAFRICKPEGQVVIINHFSNVKSNRLNFFEYILSNLEHVVGFKSKFSFKEFITDKQLKFYQFYNANMFSMTKVIFLRKQDNLHV